MAVFVSRNESSDRLLATTQESGVWDTLLADGKPKNLALTACMRKPLVTLNSMLQHGSSWRDLSPQFADTSS